MSSSFVKCSAYLRTYDNIIRFGIRSRRSTSSLYRFLIQQKCVEFLTITMLAWNKSRILLPRTYDNESAPSGSVVNIRLAGRISSAFLIVYFDAIDQNDHRRSFGLTYCRIDGEARRTYWLALREIHIHVVRGGKECCGELYPRCPYTNPFVQRPSSKLIHCGRCDV